MQRQEGEAGPCSWEALGLGGQRRLRKGKPGLEAVVSAAANEGEEPTGLCPKPCESRLLLLVSLAISAQPLPSYSLRPASRTARANLGCGRQRARGPCGHTLPCLLWGPQGLPAARRAVGSRSHPGPGGPTSLAQRWPGDGGGVGGAPDTGFGCEQAALPSTLCRRLEVLVLSALSV